MSTPASATRATLCCLSLWSGRHPKCCATLAFLKFNTCEERGIFSVRQLPRNKSSLRNGLLTSSQTAAQGPRRICGSEHDEEPHRLLCRRRRRDERAGSMGLHIRSWFRTYMLITFIDIAFITNVLLFCF